MWVLLSSILQSVAQEVGPDLLRLRGARTVTLHYNPIVRTFWKLRTGLVRHLGVARSDIRPETALADLIPVEQRREVWRKLRQEGVAVPDLELSSTVRSWGTLTVMKTAASL